MTEEVIARHSRLIGGSTASRLINCNGSYELLQKIPDTVETPSIWAAVGTAKHEAIAELIETQADPITMMGRTFEGVTFTAEHVADLRAAAEFVDRYLKPGDDYVIEQRVEFPGVDAAFGTVDLAIRKAGEPKIIVIDFKFGSGVAVQAAYDGTPNEQLLFYAAALRHTMPKFFAGVSEIELHIFQPAFDSEAEA